MKEIHIATSPLSNTIYAGTVSKSGDTWLTKRNVTGEACAAVAQHVIEFGEPVIVKMNGVEKYKITAEELP